MHNELEKLFFYYPKDSDKILINMAKIIRDMQNAECSSCCPEFIVSVRNVLTSLMQFAEDRHLIDCPWKGYVATYIAFSENVFSGGMELCGEHSCSISGHISKIARKELEALRNIFNYNFDSLKKITQNSTLCDAVGLIDGAPKSAENESREIRRLRDFAMRLSSAEDDGAFYKCVTDFYGNNGRGAFSIFGEFIAKPIDNSKATPITVLETASIQKTMSASVFAPINMNSMQMPAQTMLSAQDDRYRGKEVELIPVNDSEKVCFDDLIGYEAEKEKLISNTEAFVAGKPANNVLLYGDRGTGKSTCIKALTDRFFGKGLRVIQMYRHELQLLPGLVEMLRDMPYKFVIYMDDLSFEDYETEYKYLKAAIEGGLMSKPENIKIYATTNRRNIIKESWRERKEAYGIDDVHESDALEEKMSLADRFGVQIYFGRPSREHYHQIVETLLKRHSKDFSIAAIADEDLANTDIRIETETIHDKVGVIYPEKQQSTDGENNCPKPENPVGGIDSEKLKKAADKWELRHGGISGRCARQFVDHLIGTGSPD